MITIYGMHTCKDCDYLQPQLIGRESEYEFIDIGSHVRNLHAFMDIRDVHPLFDECKKTGKIGIPCFVLENGEVTLDAAKAGLIPNPGEEPEIVEGAACSIHGC